MHSALSFDVCWQRVAKAEANGPGEIVGHALASQIDVVTDGDRFELRHKFAPAIFSGTIAPSGTGSVIGGQITIPAQGFFRLVLGFVILVELFVLGKSLYDLVVGGHRLLTRSRTELGPGHPATLEQHFAVFLLVPLVVIPMVAILWPKAAAVKPEICQTFEEFLEKFLSNA